MNAGLLRNRTAVVIVLATVVATAVAVSFLRNDRTARLVASDPRADPAAHAREQRASEVRARFEQAVLMLHAKQYEPAIAALHRVLELEPRMPEAHVNMGYALIGLGRHGAARDFFKGAIELRPAQANAYYGLALAAEADRDLPTALGAMRAYLHLSAKDEPHRAKARSAIWEWEQALGRPGPAAKAPAPAAPGAAGGTQ